MAEYIKQDVAMTVSVLPKEYREYQTSNLDDAYEQGWDDALENLKNILFADVPPVKHKRCPICSSKVPITQDCDNGYSIEIESEEMSVWNGDECVAIFSIQYCPNCGAKIGLEEKV